MERKLQVTTSNSGAKVTRTYNHINTTLTDSDCVVFAENLNMLSANTLKKVVRTDKTNITNATELPHVTLSPINDAFWYNFLAAEITRKLGGLNGGGGVTYNGQGYFLMSVDEITNLSSSGGTFTITANCTVKANGMAQDETLTGVVITPSWYDSDYHFVFFTDSNETKDIVITSAEMISVLTGGNISADFAALINQKTSDLSITYANNAYTFTATGDHLYFKAGVLGSYTRYVAEAFRDLYDGNVPSGVTFTTQGGTAVMIIDKE